MPNFDQPHSDYTYEVFLSYSHRDKPFVEKLERALRRYRPPIGMKVPRRRLRVFRDDSEARSGRLSEELEAALRGSRTLVVICSPAARESEWVNKEIQAFAALHGSNNIFPVLAEGLPDEEAVAAQLKAEAAFPPALLAALSDTPWAADFRRAIRSRSAVSRIRPGWFHLLAAVYQVQREEIEKRERNRRLSKILVFLIGAGAALAIVGYVAVRTPARSWMPPEVEPTHLERAAVVRDPSGNPSLRVLTRRTANVLRHYEGATLDIVTVVEMDARGRAKGCFAYAVEANRVIRFEPDSCENFGGKGTLLDEWEQLTGVLNSGKPLGEIWPYLLRNSNKFFELDLTRLSWQFPSDEGLVFLDFPELDRASGRYEYLNRGAREAAQAINEKIRNMRIFRIDTAHYIGFVEVVEGNFSEDQWTLTVLTTDAGVSWKAGRPDKKIDCNGITAVSGADLDSKILYAAAYDNFDPHDLVGKSGGVFRSEDGGLSWKSVSTASASDIGTLSGAPDVLAVALTGGRLTDSGIIMTKDLHNWVSLEEGIPLQGRKKFKIAGLMNEDHVIARHGGQLMVWRKLDWIERLQGRYGVSF